MARTRRQSPVSYRSVVPGPILTTSVTLELGQPPVSFASDLATIVILDRPDEIHAHVTPPAPLLGRRVFVQCDCRPARLNVYLSDKDEHSHWRIEMKRFVTDSRSSVRHRVPVSPVNVGDIERYPWKKAWTPEYHVLRPRSRGGPSISRSQKWRAPSGLDSGPSTPIIITRTSALSCLLHRPSPSHPRSPGDRLERND